MALLQSFQAFTLRANGQANRLVSDVAVAPGYDPKAPPSPRPIYVNAKALWDTGASRSVLSTDLARALALVPTGTSQVHHGDGTSTRNTFVVNLQLPNGVRIAGVLATEFPASHSDFSVLIGMDVIGIGDFSITNVKGLTCMSFRIPSCETIDYVLEANKIKFAGTGRNAPCPCGSGKKFKLCHGSSGF